MLQVKEGIVGCLFAVNINGETCKDGQCDIDEVMLGHTFVVKEQSKSLLDYQASLDFVLSGGGIIKNGTRYALEPTDIPMDLFGIAESRKLYAYCSIHPELNLAVFSFNINIKDFRTTDIITLNQAISGGFVVPTNSPYFGTHENVKDLMKAYMEAVRKEFLGKPSNKVLLETSMTKEFTPYVLIEIKEILAEDADLTKMDNPLEILQTYPQEFYGMITGDEGYNFVPKARCEEMLQDFWTTRDFFVTIPFLMGALSLNLAASNRHKEYMMHQEEYNKTRNRSINPYFSVHENQEIAGLSHGVVVMIEEGLVVRRLLDRILLSKVLETNKDMRITLKTRKEIITTINRIASMNIMEIDSLEKLIISKMNILQDLEKVKYNLDLNQSEIDIKYSRAINTMVILFAVLQALIAIFTILSKFLG